MKGIMKSSWVAIPTPFNDDGTIYLKGFEKLIDFHIKYGTDGILVLGSAGEASMLSKKEKMEVIEFTTHYARGKIKLFVGTTQPNTSETINMTKFALKCNADGALMVVPAYIKPPQKAIYDFFKEIATTVDIPIAIYNNPMRVGVNINADTSIRLAKIPNIIAFKEAISDLSLIQEIIRNVGDDIGVMTCDSPTFSAILPCLAMGGSGVTNITGNLAPEEFATLSQPWKNFEDVIRTRELVFKYYELRQVCYSLTNPVVIKAGLNLLGLPAGRPRLPLQELDKEKTTELKEIMERLGILGKYRVK